MAARGRATTERSRQLPGPRAASKKPEDASHPSHKKREVRADLQKSLSAGLLHDPAALQPVGRPSLAVRRREEFGGDPSLRRVHANTHSPLAGHIA
jgi:hypothetical protein